MRFKNTTVAIVSSPLQLISTGEYIFQNKIKNYLIIILFYSKKELVQINEISKIYDLTLNIELKGYPIIQYFKLYFLSQKIKNCKNLLMGNFFSDPHLFFSNLISKQKTVVVDDGMIVSSIPDFIGSNKKIIKTSFIKKIFNKKFFYPKKIDLFSIFPVAEHRYISLKKNNLSFLSSMMRTKKTSSTIMIIGQPFVEHKMISLEHYTRIIQTIKSDYKNHKLVYFPSRKELPKKINNLRKICNMDIIKSVNNIEIHLLKNKFIPKKIIGFTSSALITINTIFNSGSNLIDIRSLKVNFSNKRLSDKVITRMYDTLYKHGINKY